MAAHLVSLRETWHLDVAQIVAIFAFALVVLLLSAWLMVSRSRASKRSLGPTVDAKPVKPIAASGYVPNVWSLVPAGQAIPYFWAREHELPAFEQFVVRIYEVSHGIFQGEEGGERLPSWPSGAFSAALRELRLRADAIGWPFGARLHDPLDDVALASRLIATGLDVDEAVVRVEDYRRYRAEVGGGVAPTLEWLKCGIAIVPCEDRLGRPIINIRPRYHQPGNPALFRLGLRCTLDAVKAHLIQKREHTFSNTNPLEQYAMVWDFKGSSLKNLDWDCFHVTIEEGTHNYPNMGSQIYVLNVSAPVRWIWYAARRFLHPRIRRKCLLVAPRDVPALMQRLVPPEKLPSEYGGIGRPWPSPQDAVSFEDQVGELAATVFARAGAIPEGALPLRADLSQKLPSACPDDKAGAKNSQSGFSDGGLWSCCAGVRMRQCKVM